MANDAHRVPDDQLFAAGDVRANENIELTALHTLFVREHNCWAEPDRGAEPAPGATRRSTSRPGPIVGPRSRPSPTTSGCPRCWGRTPCRPTPGYNPTVNPGIANEFSTAVFRLGHSLLGDDVEFLDNNGLPVAEEVPLSEAFFNPPLIERGGRHRPDPQVPRLRPVGQAGQQDRRPGPELPVRPSGRGRVRPRQPEHPARPRPRPGRLQRRPGRLRPAASDRFAQITSDPEVQAKLQQLYGTVDNIDLWVGALAEDHVAGGSTGPLHPRRSRRPVHAAARRRPFWYQRQFCGSFAAADWSPRTLEDIIARNTTITNLQDNVFFFKASVSGKVFNDANGNGVRNFGEDGFAARR